MLTLDAIEALFHYYNGCRGHKYVTLEQFLDYFNFNKMTTANSLSLGEKVCIS